MLKIRLQRVGRKHDPSYRIVLTEAKQGPKSGNFIENLGFYDARTNVKQVKGERVNYWIGNGAQVSDTVHNILVSEKVIEGKKVNALPKKTPIVKEVTEEEKKVAPTEEGEKEVIPAEEAVKEEPVVEEPKTEEKEEMAEALIEEATPEPAVEEPIEKVEK